MDETPTAETKAEPMEATTVATKKKTAKPSKTQRVAKAAKTKTTKQPKAKKEKTSKGPRPERTFAIRITDTELEAIHRASGARNATRCSRLVDAAFASGDEAAFRAVVKEAREARG